MRTSLIAAALLAAFALTPARAAGGPEAANPPAVVRDVPPGPDLGWARWSAVSLSYAAFSDRALRLDPQDSPVNWTLLSVAWSPYRSRPYARFGVGTSLLEVFRAPISFDETQDTHSAWDPFDPEDDDLYIIGDLATMRISSDVGAASLLPLYLYYVPYAHLVKSASGPGRKEGTVARTFAYAFAGGTAWGFAGREFAKVGAGLDYSMPLAGSRGNSALTLGLQGGYALSPLSGEKRMRPSWFASLSLGWTGPTMMIGSGR